MVTWNLKFLPMLMARYVVVFTVFLYICLIEFYRFARKLNMGYGIMI